MRGDNQSRTVGRVGELRLDDRRQGQVAEGAVSLPTFVASFGDDDLRPRARVQVRQRRQPVEAREPVPCAPTMLCVQEVVGQNRSILGRESKLDELPGDLVDDVS
jgi:hypothetical protein